PLRLEEEPDGAGDVGLRAGKGAGGGQLVLERLLGERLDDLEPADERPLAGELGGGLPRPAPLLDLLPLLPGRAVAVEEVKRDALPPPRLVARHQLEEVGVRLPGRDRAPPVAQLDLSLLDLAT